MSKIVFFEFAGRTANMEVQRPYIETLLADYPESELHLWDLTRDPNDQMYLDAWAASHPQVRVMRHLHPGHPVKCRYPEGVLRRRGYPPCLCIRHKPPYESPWRWYAANQHYPDNTTYVKFDDDVLWMDTARFGEVLEFLETHPGQVASANVINNAVCAKYEPDLAEMLARNYTLDGEDVLGDPADPANDRKWWALHTEAAFADVSHRWWSEWIVQSTHYDREPVQTREGEKVSINFVAMKRAALVQAAALMDGRFGDEGAVDELLPWIIPNFRVAHLAFGPQEKTLDLDGIRNLYRKA